MDNGNNNIAAVYYIDAEKGIRTLKRLLRLAGAEEIEDADENSERVKCKWSRLHCEAYSLRDDFHQVLVIEMPELEFLALFDGSTGESVATDGAFELARAFRESCLSLTCEAAFIVVDPSAFSRKLIDQYAGEVLTTSPTGLADAHFGLLYLSARMNLHQLSTLRGNEREDFPIVGGRMIFAHRGPKRWYHLQSNIS